MTPKKRTVLGIPAAALIFLSLSLTCITVKTDDLELCSSAVRTFIAAVQALELLCSLDRGAFISGHFFSTPTGIFAIR